VELKRLEKIFGQERAKASERIIQMSNKHDQLIKADMRDLGILN
jgi:hypothetical protein